MALAGLIVRLIWNRSLNPLWMRALRVILSRALVDPAYADITGGVLAGLEPANRVIQLRILAGTVQQAALSLGVGALKHALHGPGHLVLVGRKMAASGMSLVSETALHPIEYAGWGAGVAMGAAELVDQIVRHLVAKDSAAVEWVPSSGPPGHAPARFAAPTIRISVH